MCISLHPARFSGTVLCLSEALHPVTGRFVNTLVYENVRENRKPDGGPNAMLLHFPSKGMTRENLIDTRDFRGFTKDLIEAVRPRPRSSSNIQLKSATLGGGRVEVFKHDIYDMVLAQNAADIPGSLGTVDKEKRPDLNLEVFDYYGSDRNYDDWSFLLCCFDNLDAQKAAPIMAWYEPLMPNRVMLPGLDAHGIAPDLKEDVEVDHWVILGSQEKKSSHMQPVNYTQAGPKMTSLARTLLPKYVSGRHFSGRMRNGDFVGPVSAFAEGPSALNRGLLLAS